MDEATLFKFGKWIDYGNSYSKGKKFPPKGWWSESRDRFWNFKPLQYFRQSSGRTKVCLSRTEPSLTRSSYWSLPVGRYLSDSHCKGSVVILARWTASNMAEEPQSRRRLLVTSRTIDKKERAELCQPMFQLELGHVVLWLPCFVQMGVALLFTAMHSLTQ